MEKKKKRKRIMCMSLACMLVFSNVSTAYANPLLLLLGAEGAKAVAMVGAASLLGLTGIGLAGYVEENRDEYVEFGKELMTDFEDFCADADEWAGVTSNRIGNWLNMVAEGTLDKTSDVWYAFKDWIVGMASREGGASGGATQVYNISADGLCKALSRIDVSSLKESVVKKSAFSTTDYQTFSGKKYLEDGTVQDIYIYTSNMAGERIVYLNYLDDGNFYCVSDLYRDVNMPPGSYCYGGISLGRTTSGESSLYSSLNPNSLPYYNDSEVEHCPNFGGSYVISNSPPRNAFYGGEIVININATRKEALGDFSSIGWKMADIIIASGIINSYVEWEFAGYAQDTVSKKITIAQETKDILERDGTLDNVDVVSVDGVRDTVIPVDWDNVQDISKPYPFPDVVPVDNVEGVVIGTDIPIEDVPTLDPDSPVTGVPQKTGYTVSGLETVFPFCIPFDLVKIFTLFKAEPLAPKFNYTFTYFVGGDKKTKNIDIDLSKFNSVAELLRTVELIAFMVALTLKTRDLIRG